MFGPLSYQLAQVSISFGISKAPLYSVSNVNGQQQASFQVPCDVAPNTSVPVTVNANGGTATVNVSMRSAGPGVFTFTDSDSLQHAVIVLDRAGVLTTWNQTAERLWGLRAEHVLQRPFWSLPVGEIGHKVREILGRVLESGNAETLNDVPFQMPTGETRKLTLQITPLKSNSGDITGAVGVASALEPGVSAAPRGGTPR